jgi:isochorismate synthase
MIKLTVENINQIVASKKAFAIVRLPDENSFHVKAGEWIRCHFDEINENCFFVQPFSPDEKGFALGLRPNKTEEKREDEISIPIVISQEIYEETFEKFMTEISAGNIKKMILSKVKQGSDEKIDIGESFFLLCENYPSAAVNLFFIPGVGLWMGASPELLLRAEVSRIETMSLAGTLPEGLSGFTSKEREEQKIVTDYITSVFAKIDSKPVVEKQETVMAGNVKHLCNHFELKIKYDQKIVNQLVKDLHPTPAVGGFPKKESIDFISKTEKHNREFYAGYFGFVEPGTKTELYVNIRCMKIVGHIPYIFTGGGITKESNGLAEWNETEMKALGLINSLCFGEN